MQDFITKFDHTNTNPPNLNKFLDKLQINFFLNIVWQTYIQHQKNHKSLSSPLSHACTYCLHIYTNTRGPKNIYIYIQTHIVNWIVVSITAPN